MAFLEGRTYQPDALEQRVLELWRTHDAFRESVRRRRDAPDFVFLEGPPTANGLPHPGHVLTRTLKDAVCRYKTMRGHRVERKAGWDCHGLPVEIEVEKELGLRNKQDIERYGVAAFNAKCRESVFRYKKEWEAMSQRVGFWLDFDHPYVTLENEYIESVWWSLQQAWKKGLLYEGFRVAAYCPRCGTGLSSHEVGLGYRSVEEPSVFLKFPLAGRDGTYILAWTTTPWTLPGNVALAVGPDIEYVEVQAEGKRGTETYYLAKDLLGVLRPGHRVVRALRGRDMAGWRYEPLYSYTRDVLERVARDPGLRTQVEGVNLGWALGTKPHGEEHPERRWTVVEADFVTTTDGTGVVHTAVMYGEDDYELGMRLGLPAVHTVDAEGRFKPFVTKFAGRFVKDADPDIIEDLRDRDLLYRVKNHTHDYPFCWRCSTPLLYYARDQWFLRMSHERARLVDFNARVQWVPPHVKEGRFGDFIRNVRDWALSRDRYWGTPLPVWTCGGCGHRECVGSIAELMQLGGDPVRSLVASGRLDLHKPAVDEIHLTCPACRGRMDRDPNVIDTWYDSGAAAFAQWHYPFDPKTKALAEAPVDFITEGIDQTRGWFYTLLAESTFLFEREAYKAVVVAGLVLDEKGLKMSKSKKNYTDPNLIFREYGADAMRWNLLSSSVTADKRFFAASIRETYTRFILTLWNTYQFFRGYAALDGWRPGAPAPAAERPALDRWLLERLASVAATARTEGDAYNIHKATQAIESFLVDDLSNWWVRRSRRRFWGETPSLEKASAYATLYDALAGVVALAAPYAPFLTEALHQDLRGPHDPASVHWLDYPTGEPRAGPTELEREMQQVRALTEAARALRSKAGVKTRIPLRRLTIVRASPPSAVFRSLLPILEEEANVKEVAVGTDAAGLEEFEARPDRARVGRDLKAQAKAVLEDAAGRDPRALGRELRARGAVTLASRTLDASYFVVTSIAKEGTLKADVGPDTLFLDATLTRELEDEGWAREITRRIQEMRKEAGLELTDAIEVSVAATPSVERALGAWRAQIAAETRARTLQVGGAPDGATPREWDIDGEKVTIALRRVTS